MVPVVAELLGRARAAEVPVIYANDNFGSWRSHHGELPDIALARPYAPGLIEPIRPDEESLFVVKARHSVFCETPLAYLLSRLGVGALEMMERNMGARVVMAKEIDLGPAHTGR
ncbi:hypothetical protein CVT30_00965 [Streptomyces sp. AMCC400023]|nr:hypothetical protein CVT30_00965 [Streptomyces sp. AMCC400023]